MTGLGEGLLWRSESLGVALVDGAARIVRASPTLLRITPRAVAGAAVAAVAEPAQRDAMMQLLQNAGHDWSTIRAAVPGPLGTRDYRVWAARTDEGVLVVVEPLWHDVATVDAALLGLNEELVHMERELRRRGEELAEQNERLLELDRLKEEFVALVSHELRTPLASMQGYLELLAEDAQGLGESGARFLLMLERNVARLLRLVDDLLFVVQLDAGVLRLELEEVDLAALVDDCVAAVAPAAAAKGVSVEARAGGRALVEADRGRLAQLLDNLLTNAIKFTPPGGRVDVAAEPSGAGPVLRVSDTGVGIPENERERIFDRFYRVAGDDRRTAPGTGLGLAVARAIADAHRARIEVEARDGTGTTFTVALPPAPDVPQA